MLVGAYGAFRKIHEEDSETYKTTHLGDVNLVQTLKSSRNLTKNTQKWSGAALHQKQNNVHSIKFQLRERHQCVRKLRAN